MVEKNKETSFIFLQVTKNTEIIIDPVKKKMPNNSKNNSQNQKLEINNNDIPKNEISENKSININSNSESTIQSRTNTNINISTNNNINNNTKEENLNQNQINNEGYQYKMNSPFIMPTTYMNMGMNYYPPTQYMYQQKPPMGMPFYAYQQNQGMGKPIYMPMYYPINMNQMNNNYGNFKQQPKQNKEKSK